MRIGHLAHIAGVIVEMNLLAGGLVKLDTSSSVFEKLMDGNSGTVKSVCGAWPSVTVILRSLKPKGSDDDL